MALDIHESKETFLNHVNTGVPGPEKHLGKPGIPLDYHPLPCARCGKLLSPKPGKNELLCHHCGHHHPYLVFSPENDSARFREGDAVAVEWDGLWWPAHIVNVIEERKTWRVHFNGWGPAFDDVVGMSRIRRMDAMVDAGTISDAPEEVAQSASVPTDTTNSLAGLILMVMIFLLLFALLLLSAPLEMPDIFKHFIPPHLDTSAFIR